MFEEEHQDQNRVEMNQRMGGAIGGELYQIDEFSNEDHFSQGNNDEQSYQSQMSFQKKSKTYNLQTSINQSTE